jgi:hypothetical protein
VVYLSLVDVMVFFDQEADEIILVELK